MIARIRHIAENEFLQSCILFLILVNAGLLGLMTYPSFSGSYRDYSEIILSISQVVFTIEIVIRIVVYAPNYKKFFAEFSNIFDFIIIIISFIPAVGSIAFTARVLRVFRALRIFSVSDKLREYIGEIKLGLSAVISSFIIYVVLLYVYSIIGFYFFSEITTGWSTLHKSISQIFLISILSGETIIKSLLDINSSYLLFFILVYGSFGTLYIHTIASVVSKYINKK